jgi:hypothetical protein
VYIHGKKKVKSNIQKVTYRHRITKFYMGIPGLNEIFVQQHCGQTPPKGEK